MSLASYHCSTPGSGLFQIVDCTFQISQAQLAFPQICNRKSEILLCCFSLAATLPADRPAVEGKSLCRPKGADQPFSFISLTPGVVRAGPPPADNRGVGRLPLVARLAALGEHTSRTARMTAAGRPALAAAHRVAHR